MTRLARTALAATFLTAVSTQAFAQDLTIWWNKSYYPEEDEQFDKTVAAFEAESGLDVEYVYYTNEDVPRKVLAALTAGDPPDLAYGFLFDLQHTSRWAYDGVLADVSDVVEPIQEHLLPTALQSVTLLNGQTGERSIYAIPVAQQIEHIHVWKSLVEQAGLSLDDLPPTWNEWWDWWCETAQPAVREATGDRQKYGIGHAMSSAASDTIFAYMMFLNAFDTQLVDDEGNLIVDQPETREGMIKALESYTKSYLDGCVPPGSVNWQDGDNNVNFKNQISIMVPNPSLSIPASEYENKERYFEEMVTVEWPDKPDGSPIEYIASIKTAVIFEDAENKEAAKEFMRFYLKPENLGPQLEGSLARWFPVDQRIIEMPFWHAKDDPHKVVETAQYTQRPQSVWPHYLNYKLIDINAENAIGKAVGRVVLEDWSAEDAVDELIARIQQVAGT